MAQPENPQICFGRKAGNSREPILDNSDAHIMTIAPTGAGKGRSSIIPNLLEWPGSAFVIDPKAENAEFTFKRRSKGFQQNVFILDPFGITRINGQSIKSARFNPLRYIDFPGPAGITQADRLADTLILREGGDHRFFSDEARALLKTLILHVRSHPDYDGRRHLRTVNEIASNPEDSLGRMQCNPCYDGLISRLACRMAAKAEKEGGAVWSTLQANLGQFLDDPRIGENLSHSDFDFKDLLKGNMTVFAVLPAQYLETFNRWLRLLVGTALDRILSESMGEKRRRSAPVLMILDEFAHLGHLEAIKTAYGLARGAGVKVWAILQSLSQLDDIYGEHGRENFIANSGSIEIFNMSDNHGTQYFSSKIGDAFMVTRSTSLSVGTDTDSGTGRGYGGSVNSLSRNENIQEQLQAQMLPWEIAMLGANKKLVFRRDQEFVIVEKTLWDQDPKLRRLAE